MTFEIFCRFQISHEDFRQRISQDEEDINSILYWYKLTDAVFLGKFFPWLRNLNYEIINRISLICDFNAFQLVILYVHNISSLDHLSQEIKLTNSSAVWRYLIGYKNLLRAIENLGIAVVYGIRYYGQGNLTADNYVQFIKHDTLSSAYLNQSINFVPYVRKNFEKIKKEGSEYWTWQSSRHQVLSTQNRVPDIQEAYQYFLATYRYKEDLRFVLSSLREKISNIIGNEIRSANENQVLGILILMLVLFISPAIIGLVRQVPEKMNCSLLKRTFQSLWQIE